MKFSASTSVVVYQQQSGIWYSVLVLVLVLRSTCSQWYTVRHLYILQHYEVYSKYYTVAAYHFIAPPRAGRAPSLRA